MVVGTQIFHLRWMKFTLLGWIFCKRRVIISWGQTSLNFHWKSHQDWKVTNTSGVWIDICTYVHYPFIRFCTITRWRGWYYTVHRPLDQRHFSLIKTFWKLFFSFHFIFINALQNLSFKILYGQHNEDKHWSEEIIFLFLGHKLHQW